MMDKKRTRAWKNLMCGILNEALIDAKKRINVGNVLYFAQSTWCEALCSETNVNYELYLRKITELCKIK